MALRREEEGGAARWRVVVVVLSGWRREMEVKTGSG